MPLAARFVLHWFLIGGLIGLWLGAPVRAADYPAWLAADLNPDPPTPEFALFPIRGPRLIVPLPESLRNRTISVFGAEGKAVCALTARGIIKVEFNPLRQEIIPGSSEVSSIWSLTVVRESGHVFVSGLAARGGAERSRSIREPERCEPFWPGHYRTAEEAEERYLPMGSVLLSIRTVSWNSPT
jgi:hypothetical protein